MDVQLELRDLEVSIQDKEENLRTLTKLRILLEHKQAL